MIEIEYKEDTLSFRKIAINNIEVDSKEEASPKKTAINTIEFRNPNGSLNPVIWQNNINLFTHFLKYATNPKFDYDLIQERMNIQDFSRIVLLTYNEINIRQALELADLIFDNNLDKINFLRQYIKDYEHNDSYVKSKVFTKK